MELLLSSFDLTALALRFAIHIGALFAIVFLLYFRGTGSREFCFSYIAIGVVVFSLCFLLERVKLELGFALGLFAIFGIIRYRTITIPIKEMTYLFVVIGLSVINSLAGGTMSATALALANLAIVLCIAGLETFMMKKPVQSILMRYEKIENLRPDQQAQLYTDLKLRLGLDVTHYEIEQVDFLRDTANLRVFFEAKPSKERGTHVSHAADHIVFDS